MPETCAICLEEVTDGKALQCQHTYHASCIDEWFKQKAECPICRETYVIEIGVERNRSRDVDVYMIQVLMGFSLLLAIFIHDNFLLVFAILGILCKRKFYVFPLSMGMFVVLNYITKFIHFWCIDYEFNFMMQSLLILAFVFMQVILMIQALFV